jgi:copper(I)-binding protein
MTARTRTAIAGVIAGALLLASCGSSDDASTSTTKPDETTTTAADSLEITDAWARQSPMGTSAGAVYLTITSPVDDALIGASVPTSVAGTTEIHETVMADESSTTEAMGDESSTTEMMGDTTETTMAGSDSMTMRPVDAIELPAGEAVALEPGGYHIMLLDLVEPLKAGETVEVTLTFEEAGERTVTAEVREA